MGHCLGEEQFWADSSVTSADVAPAWVDDEAVAVRLSATDLGGADFAKGTTTRAESVIDYVPRYEVSDHMGYLVIGSTVGGFGTAFDGIIAALRHPHPTAVHAVEEYLVNPPAWSTCSSRTYKNLHRTSPIAITNNRSTWVTFDLTLLEFRQTCTHRSQRSLPILTR